LQKHIKGDEKGEGQTLIVADKESRKKKMPHQPCLIE